MIQSKTKHFGGPAFALTAAIASSWGCGVGSLIQVNGKPLGSSSDKPAPQPASNQPQAAGANQPQAAGANQPAAAPVKVVAKQKISVDGAWKRNPMIYGAFQGPTEVSVSKFGVDSRCNGYVLAEPSLEVANPKGMKNVQVTAAPMGQGSSPGIILVMFDSGTYFCEQVHSTGVNPTLLIGDLPAGNFKVYVGDNSSQRAISASVSLEQLDKPRDIPWLALERPKIDIAGAPKPEVVTQILSQADFQSLSRANGPGLCRGPENFPASPGLELNVTKRSTFKLGVNAWAEGSLAIIGPLTKDGRNLEHRCLNEWQEQMTLDAGRYFVHFGMRKEDRPSFVRYWVKPEHGAKVELDPLSMVDVIPEGMPVGERTLGFHFPFFEYKQVLTSDEFRAALFAKAPKHLFVSPSLDLDKNSATAVLTFDSYSGGDKYLHSDDTIEFPKEGEAMLLVAGTTVLGADGSLFQVQIRDLQPAEKAKAHLPSAARNPHIYYSHAHKLAGPEDKSRLAKHKKAWDDYEKCTQKVWKGAQGQLKRLYDYPHLNRNKIARVEHETRVKAEKKCGLAKLEEYDQKIWRELETTRNARRSKALEQARARWK